MAVLGFARPPAIPGEAIRLGNLEEILDISDRIGVLPDAGFSPARVRAGEQDGQFRRKIELKSQGVYWLRFALENATGETSWRVQLQPFLTLERFGEEGVQVNGHRIPFSRTAYPTNRDMVDVQVPPHSTRICYIRAETRQGAGQLRATLTSATAYGRESFRDALEMAFVQGILLVMAGYNLILYRSLRDSSYLSYSIFILSLSFFLVVDSGYFYPLTGLDAPVLLLQHMSPLLATCVFVHFTCTFLQAPRLFPAWNRFWTWFILSYVLLTSLDLCLYYQGGAPGWANRIVAIMNLQLTLAAVFMVIFSAHACRQGYEPAWHFLQANLVFFCCVLIWMLGPQLMNILDLGVITRSAMHLGVTLQVTLFSLALGGRFQGLQAEKEAQARERLLEIQRWGEEKNLELEHKVAERTEELHAAHQQLAQAQDKLANLRDAPLDRLEDIALWAAAMAADFQATLGVAALGVFELRNGTLFPIRPLPDAVEPDMGMVLASMQGKTESAGMLIIPARGLSGEMRGVVAVMGFAPQDSRSGQRQLLNGFASHLGNAFEMAQIQHKLRLAETIRATSLEEYEAKGIELLKLCPHCGLCYSASLNRCDADGTELEMPSFLPLRILDRYRFTRRLGEGGMGMVLEALDENLNRPVAIKLMRPEHFNDMAARQRFEREVHTLVLVNHPGVVTVFDSGELGDGTLYLIMERLKGLDLSAMIRRHGPGSPSQVARLVRQGAAALSAAHLLQVVHRDIKPQNLFLTAGADGFQVRLLDFGLAKDMNAGSHLTQTGFMMGTPIYMAPEQILGREVDARTDTFAFASVIHQALLGHPPVRATGLSDIISAILYAPFESLSFFAPWLPGEVDAAFASALAKDPSLRPDHLGPWAEELAECLEELEGFGSAWPEAARWDKGERRPSPGDQPTATFSRPTLIPGEDPIP